MRRSLSSCLLLITLPTLLAGCDLPGMESASVVAARKEAEGKAVGGACRHAGRAIEDCYTLNKKTEKSAVFAGWREMNDYMRENKIEAVAPQLPPPGLPPPKPPEDAEPEEKPAAKSANGGKPGKGH